MQLSPPLAYEACGDEEMLGSKRQSMVDVIVIKPQTSNVNKNSETKLPMKPTLSEDNRAAIGDLAPCHQNLGFRSTSSALQDDGGLSLVDSFADAHAVMSEFVDHSTGAEIADVALEGELTMSVPKLQF
jgi:hypothetical protein